MTRVQPIFTKHPLIAWLIVGHIFLGAGFGSCAGMRSLLDRYEFLHTPPAAVLVTLGAGFFAWVAWRVWRYGHPWLCAGAMGFLSGVAGAGGVMLLVDLLTALMPAGGITSTIR